MSSCCWRKKGTIAGEDDKTFTASPVNKLVSDDNGDFEHLRAFSYAVDEDNSSSSSSRTSPSSPSASRARGPPVITGVSASSPIVSGGENIEENPAPISTPTSIKKNVKVETTGQDSTSNFQSRETSEGTGRRKARVARLKRNVKSPKGQRWLMRLLSSFTDLNAGTDSSTSRDGEGVDLQEKRSGSRARSEGGKSSLGNSSREQSRENQSGVRSNISGGIASKGKTDSVSKTGSVSKKNGGEPQQEETSTSNKPLNAASNKPLLNVTKSFSSSPSCSSPSDSSSEDESSTRRANFLQSILKGTSSFTGTSGGGSGQQQKNLTVLLPKPKNKKASGQSRSFTRKIWPRKNSALLEDETTSSSSSSSSSTDENKGSPSPSSLPSPSPSSLPFLSSGMRLLSGLSLSSINSPNRAVLTRQGSVEKKVLLRKGSLEKMQKK